VNETRPFISAAWSGKAASQESVWNLTMGTKYAILIGINGYHESLGRLKYCVNDVRRLAEVLTQGEDAFPKDRLLVLTPSICSRGAVLTPTTEVGTKEKPNVEILAMKVHGMGRRWQQEKSKCR